MAIALPDGSIATCGSQARWPAADRSWGACQTPLAAGRTAAWTMGFVLERTQTAIAFPGGSIATCAP
jgi:hypothetical protein